MVLKIGAQLKQRWETRDQLIGPRNGDKRELHILNRTLRWCKDGLAFAADPRHAKEVVEELGLCEAKPVSSPAVPNPPSDEGSTSVLDETGKRQFQRITAKLN